MADNKKKVFHYIKSLLIGLVLFLIGFVGLAYYLLTNDNEKIPALLCQVVKEELGIEMAFAHFNVDRTINFPYLTILVEDVYIQGSHYDTYGKDLMRVNELSLVLPPWEFLYKKYSFHKVVVDSASVFFLKDDLGKSNTEFMKKLIKPKEKNIATAENQSGRKVSMKQIHFNHVSFTLENELKNQEFKVEFIEGDLNINKKAGIQNFVLDAQCQFKGLFFKKEKGGYLQNKEAHLQLDIDLDTAQIKLNPSLLEVEGDELKLEGYLTKTDTNYIHLGIKTDGILLTKAASLLPKNIQKALSVIEIDKPLATDFELVGPLIPGRPTPIHIDFTTNNANLKFQEITINQLNLAGNFSNDCFVTDYIRPNSSCLTIHDLDGMLLDKIPTKLSGRINDLKGLKDVEAIGQVQFPLSVLKEYLEQEGQVEVTKGFALMEFDYKGNLTELVQKKISHQKQLNAIIQLEDIALNLNNKSFPLQVLKGQVQLNKTKVKLRNLDLKMPGINGLLNGHINNVIPFLLGENQRLDNDLSLALRQVKADKFLKNFSFNNKGTLLGNKLAEFIHQVTDLTDANIALSIQDFDYQKFNAQDLALTIKLAKECANNESSTSKACLQISNIKATILQDIETSGNLSITNMADPELNMDMVLTTPVSTAANFLDNPQFSATAGTVELNTIAKLHLNDYPQMDKLLERIVFSSSFQLKDISAIYLPKQLALEHLTSQFYLNKDTLLINNLSFNYQDVSPQISGNVTNFMPLILGEQLAAAVDLNIIIPTLNLENRKTADSTMTVQIGDSLFAPRAAIAQLDDIFKTVDGKIGLTIQDLHLPDYPIENLSFLLNLDKSSPSQKEELHSIGIEAFHADIFGDIPVDGSFQIKNLKDPSLSIALNAFMPMHDLNRLLYNDNCVAHSGEIALQLDYDVPISDELTPKNYIIESDLKGQIQFKDVSVTYPARDYKIESLNGLFKFNEKDLDIDTLNLRINGNQIYGKGHCPDFLPYFFLEGQLFEVHLAVNSPSFDIGAFSTPRTVGEMKNLISAELEQTNRINIIDQILKEGTIEFATNIEELIYGPFVANRVVGKVHVGSDEVALDKLAMEVASGKFGVHGIITNISEHHPTLAVEAYFKGTDIEKVFKGFQNFGQQEITDANVKGTLFSDIRFKADLDDHYQVKPASIDGEVAMEVIDGELINFPALKKMTGFLFKKRHLEDIYFDTLLTKLEFDGLDMKIHDFNIRSSAATLSIDGLYTFNKEEDRTHIFFEVPLSNLFKRYIDPRKRRKHRAKRSGLPILVEAIEEGKKLKFKLRLFKRNHEK